MPKLTPNCSTTSEKLESVFPGTLLIIAASGRMLAEAAHKAGIAVWVIDLFADLDTRRYAVKTYCCASLAFADIEAAVDEYLDQHATRWLLYGGGLESHPETLAILQRHFHILGNSADCFAEVNDKRQFFEVLQSEAIPFPETCFEPPNQSNAWLSKPLRGQGGYGIHNYPVEGLSDRHCYWQRYQTGQSASALFLANGEHVSVLGFHKQWACSKFPEHPYQFAGLAAYPDLSPSVQKQTLEILPKLVKKWRLVGLNGLDFIVQDDKFWCLEINARPPASMQLYPDNLLMAHLQACQGKVDYVSHQNDSYRAWQIVYAEQSIIIPDNMDWPETCKDLPPAGVKIQRGQPICSIMAHDKNAECLPAKLYDLQQTLLTTLPLNH